MPQSEVVSLRGADALGYLDTQCTQDLTSLDVNGRATTLLLAPSGEIVTIATVHRVLPDVMLLEVPAGTGDATVARLERFAIRADVAFSAHEAPVEAPRGWFADALARIAAGVPGAAELARGLVPHGIGEELRASCVSLTKGCYPGQELVARMQARDATPPYVLRRCTLDGPAHPDDPIGDPDKDGRLTSVAIDLDTERCLALCVLHRRDAAGETAEVRTASGSVVARFE